MHYITVGYILLSQFENLFTLKDVGLFFVGFMLTYLLDKDVLVINRALERPIHPTLLSPLVIEYFKVTIPLTSSLNLPKSKIKIKK